MAVAISKEFKDTFIAIAVTPRFFFFLWLYRTSKKLLIAQKRLLNFYSNILPFDTYQFLVKLLIFCLVFDFIVCF